MPSIESVIYQIHQFIRFTRTRFAVTENRLALKEVGIEKPTTSLSQRPPMPPIFFVTLTARHLNAQIRIIARASSKELKANFNALGQTNVIMPDVLGGIFMAQLVTKPIVIEFLDLLNGVSGSNYHLEEVG